MGAAAKAVTSMSSVELDEARGKRSAELGSRSGGGSKVVARPDDVVFLDE